MTCDPFAECLVEFDGHGAQQQKSLACARHHVQPKLTAVTVLFSPSHATSKVQSLDMGINVFKIAYHRRFVQRLLIATNRPASNIRLRVNLFIAVEMLRTAWMELVHPKLPQKSQIFQQYRRQRRYRPAGCAFARSSRCGFVEACDRRRVGCSRCGLGRLFVQTTTQTLQNCAQMKV